MFWWCFGIPRFVECRVCRLYGGRTKRRKAARSKILRPYDQFRQPWPKPLAGRVAACLQGTLFRTDHGCRRVLVLPCLEKLLNSSVEIHKFMEHVSGIFWLGG